MIFVTVGAQMPFDRMVRVVDRWAGERGRDDVFGQIGHTEFEPAHIRWEAFIEPEAFKRSIAEAELIVAHAGMGSIISALSAGKPIVVMPRLASLRETRNEHQTATMERFSDRPGVFAARDEEALIERLDHVEELAGGEELSPEASDELIDALTGFLRGIRN